MRNAEVAADLEHRPAAGHLHRTLRIADRDQRLAVSLEQRPQPAPGEDQCDRADIRGEQAVPEVPQPHLLSCVHQWNVRFEPGAIRPQNGELAAHRQETERGEHRQQQRRTEQQRAYSLVERAPTMRA